MKVNSAKVRERKKGIIIIIIEHDHIIKHSSVHYKTNLDCHKKMNHPRKEELTLIQIHEAIMTHYKFVNNPYLNDMLNMKEIKYGGLAKAAASGGPAPAEKHQETSQNQKSPVE